MIIGCGAGGAGSGFMFMSKTILFGGGFPRMKALVLHISLASRERFDIYEWRRVRSGVLIPERQVTAAHFQRCRRRVQSALPVAHHRLPKGGFVESAAANGI